MNIKSKKSYTYFIKASDTNYIKIGKSDSVFHRLNSLQIGCPHKLIVLGITDQFSEKILHKRFKKFLVGNEWFELSPEIKFFIEQNTNLMTDDHSKKYWSVQISKNLRNVVSDHCNKYGLKMSRFIENSITEYIEFIKNKLSGSIDIKQNG